MAIGLEKVGDRIASVEAREVTTGIIRRFRAPVFIDATGDGWLGYWAGADCRYGREAHSEFGEAWEKHGDLWSPETPDNRVMGSSVLWNSEQTDERSDFPDVPWAMPVAKEHSAINGEWYWEYSDNDLNQIDDAEQIRDHMLRAIYGSFANAKKDPKNATVALKWVAYVAGKRESRRLMGDHIYTMHDMTERRRVRRCRRGRGPRRRLPLSARPDRISFDVPLQGAVPRYGRHSTTSPSAASIPEASAT